jgi:hypothetical protein
MNNPEHRLTGDSEDLIDDARHASDPHSPLFDPRLSGQ